MKYIINCGVSDHPCRTPQGVRGLKFRLRAERQEIAKSHPARGAWIEIEKLGGKSASEFGRTPQGVRGLK